MSNLKVDETTDNLEEDARKQRTAKADDDGPNDDEDAELDDAQGEKPRTRQDSYYCFTNEKDLRHHETILIKASLYTGIAVRVKVINQYQMENLLLAVEQAGDGGIINLRFEECRLLKRAVVRIIDFCRTTTLIESLCLMKVSFDDGQDFKRLVEAVSFNTKVKQFAVNGAEFDEDYPGKTLARLILESRSLKELDLSNVTFEDPKAFYEMANGLLNERCRLQALKLRGISFGQLESKVMQFILMRNKSLVTLDLSNCSTDSPENLENVFSKFDQFCNVRHLVAESLTADFNYVVELFGEALCYNTKLEAMSIQANKIRPAQYCIFWELMAGNRSLRRMDVSRTEVTDKVCVKISTYLQSADLRLQELNLSRNQIAADGLIALGEALVVNKSLQRLNLSQNFIREGGIPEFVQALNINTTLEELSLSMNKINNTGMTALSEFLPINTTLKVLEINRNAFQDAGFVDFARGLAVNNGIESLNLSRNKDVTDEVGLRVLADALATNSSLSVIDLSGLKVRKPCVVNFFSPALKQNITLKRIIGRIPPGIINDDLKDNLTIECDVICKYRTIKKDARRELAKLPLHRLDGDQTQLALRDQRNELLAPALKFIRYRRIQAVDLSNMQLEDESLRQLASYLEENPPLRSLAVADNFFTDDGVAQLIHSLRNNTRLNHINMLGCASITNQSLAALEAIVTEVNMSLYAVELDTEQFNPEFLESIARQTAMNRAIQEHLKPERRITDEGLAEIRFDAKCPVKEHFESAIKAWRILEPSVISVQNAGLDDDHVEQLTKFLTGRNLVQTLNLRRNKIGDRGAIAIAEYVRKGDRTLTKLELERNLIGDEGGESLLRAMQANMRMERCKITYGNPLEAEIGRQLVREIEANLQINATVVPAARQRGNSLERYEETDRGPDFVRCALKSCELFKILHLSLPDNMIGKKEMKDIAYVIGRNTPLRTLNLAENVVDAKAARILADALCNNSNLRELDLTSNCLKDAGIAVLLEIFTMQKLQKWYRRSGQTGDSYYAKALLPPGEKPENKKMNAVAASEAAEGGTEVEQDEAKRQDRLLRKEMLKMRLPQQRRMRMKLSKIMLNDNNSTAEALKHIYTLLLANKKICVTIDLPAAEESSDDEASSEEEAQGLMEAQGNDDDAEAGSHRSLQGQAATIAALNGSAERNSQNDMARLEGSGSLDAAEDVQVDDDLAVDMHDVQLEEVAEPPAICKHRFLRKCRKYCYPKAHKPREPCFKIFCPGFVAAKAEAQRFKLHLSLLTVAEVSTQVTTFKLIIASLVLQTICGLVLPFAMPQDDANVKAGSIMHSLPVYGAFAVALLFQLISELVTLFSLRSIFSTPEANLSGAATQEVAGRHLSPQDEERLEHIRSHGPSCNSYIIVRMLQGILISASSFTHICFVAVLIRSVIRRSQDEKNEDGILLWIDLLIAIFGIVAITAGNWKRLGYFQRYLSSEPEVHRLMPHGFRNSQLSWVLGHHAQAILLESLSLSEFMLDLGEQQQVGVKKRSSEDDEDIELPTIEAVAEPMLNQKLKYQDAPMCILIIAQVGVAMAGHDSPDSFVSMIYLIMSACSMLAIYLMTGSKRDNKIIDVNHVIATVQGRLDEHMQKDGAKQTFKGSDITLAHESESGDDGVGTKDSELSSSDDLGDAIQELEHLLKKDKDADESRLAGTDAASNAPPDAGLSPKSGARGDLSFEGTEKAGFKNLDNPSGDLHKEIEDINDVSRNIENMPISQEQPTTNLNINAFEQEIQAEAKTEVQDSIEKIAPISGEEVLER